MGFNSGFKGLTACFFIFTYFWLSTMFL